MHSRPFAIRYSVEDGILQIVNVSHRDQGVYTCLARTPEDGDKAAALLLVIGELILRAYYSFLTQRIWDPWCCVCVWNIRKQINMAGRKTQSMFSLLYYSIQKWHFWDVWQFKSEGAGGSPVQKQRRSSHILWRVEWVDWILPPSAFLAAEIDFLWVPNAVLLWFSDVPDAPQYLVLSEHKSKSVKLKWIPGDDHNSSTTGTGEEGHRMPHPHSYISLVVLSRYYLHPTADIFEYAT